MKTTVLPVDPLHPQSQIIDQAAKAIQAGGLVAFPTETVYGLGANALDAAAVTRIFAAKGRPAHDPIIVHLSGVEMLADLVASLSPTAVLLAKKFWPGALTLVLPKSDRVPMVVTAQGPTVAVRCPDHAVAQALIEAAGLPIAAPSANRFSHTSPTTAQHVFDDLGGKIDLILDGGPTAIGVESTVLDVSGERPMLLRPGGVPLEALVAALGPIDQPRRRPPSQALPSPGMLDRHYAPQAKLTLYTGSASEVRNAISRDAQALLDTALRIGLLLADEDLDRLAMPGCQIMSVGSERDLATVANRLFGAMRALDAAGVDLILARDFGTNGLGLAVRDRLRRAAEEIVAC